MDTADCCEPSSTTIRNRFYPDTIPTFSNEPTTDRFAINFIGDNVGQGVVALVDFEAGETLFQFTGFLMTEITQFSLQITPGLHLHDPYFMGKVLHSCDPNATVDMQTRTFTALRGIEAGEWITMNYAQTEDYLYKPFTCNCGAVNCIGFVQGRLEREADHLAQAG